MFCPKCGNQLPDGSSFCGRCGAQLRAPAASPTASPGGPAGGAGTAMRPVGKVSPLGIAPAVLAAVAVVASLMPWFEVSPTYTTMTGYVDEAASFFGIGSSASLAFEESYAPMGLPGLADTFGEYASLYGMLGGSDANAATAVVGLCSWAVAALWAASAVLLVWGAVAGVLGRRRAPMLAWAIVAVLCWVAFLALSGMLGDFGEATAMPVVFAIAAIAATVCSFMGRRV